jgi:hypothetical protein
MRANVPAFTITVARSFVAVAGLCYAVDLYRQTSDHLTNGAGRPFGDDFINFWSGAFLALNGRAAEVYDFNAFHAFEQSVAGAQLDFYHYSYPPVLMLITAPLAAIPYVPALFVWLAAGWAAFYQALKLAMPGGGALLLALATPAVLINALGGQNGTWTAALFGGGLCLLPRRPYVAGILFGLMIYKPQLGILLPVALIAGRQWRAIAAATVTVLVLLAASALLLGTDVWLHYVRNVDVLRQFILEDGTGVWHRMVSVFVMARRLGADVPVAHAVQAISAVVACIAVAVVWFRDMPADLRNAVLVLATFLATPYLQDYDLVLGAFVVVWMWQQPVSAYPSERALQFACLLVLLLPFVASLLAKSTGLAFGPLFLLPAFVLALRASLRPQETALAADAVPR